MKGSSPTHHQAGKKLLNSSLTQEGSPLSKQTLYIIRHGQTQWSLSGKHTGLTDIPLTEEGTRQAKCLHAPLTKPKLHFDAILVSPLIRAQNTFKACGLTGPSRLEPLLVEWDYGRYEGMTTAEIHEKDPDWTIFSKGAPEGESLEEIQLRADKLIKKVKGLGSTIALFTSGHISRAIIARWIGQPVSFGRHILSSTASISILSYDRKAPVIHSLNDTSHYQN